MKTAGLRTSLEATHLVVEPGQVGRIEIGVTNTSDLIDGVTAIVDGLDPNWIRFDEPLISLFPSSSSTLGIDVDIPATCPAGDYLVVIRVLSVLPPSASGAEPSRECVHDLWVTVTPVVDVAVTVRPRIVTGGSTATVHATLANTGNVEAPIVVSAFDTAREVDCRVTPSEITVPFGHDGLVEIAMRGPRPWFGQVATRSITLVARSGDDEVAEVVTFRQRPRIPRGLLTVAILAGIVALWAAIFLLAVNRLGSGEELGKASATGINDPSTANVPIVSVAGSVEGRVVAATTGGAVAGITVDAFRQKNDGSTVPGGSAATDEDGVFSFATLLPGDYLFRFGGEGYDDVWFPAAVSEAGATVVTVPARGSPPALEMVLVGRTGEIVGAIALPDTNESTPVLDVVAILETGEPPPGVPPPPEVRFELQTTTGEIRLTGLPTPGTYSITVSGVGFETQTFQQTLTGGETTVLNTVRLGAASGSITGQVVDGAGNLLGGVTVRVSSGDVAVETTTPTTGDVGSFVVVGLETPATYVLTFSLEGYSSETISRELLAGQTLDGIVAQLVGGVGSTSGTVTDSSGTALGDITVTVAGNDFEATTSTLTTGGPAGGVGSFFVSDIPVPGSYTVTFTSPAHLTEVVQIAFERAGAQPGVDVVLQPRLGTIEGRVTGAGAPLGDATVTLTNGREPRITATATAPAGRYVFTDVDAGTYVLIVESPDFEPRAVLLRVGAGEVLQRDVALQRSVAG